MVVDDDTVSLDVANVVVDGETLVLVLTESFEIRAGIRVRVARLLDCVTLVSRFTSSGPYLHLSFTSYQHVGGAGFAASLMTVDSRAPQYFMTATCPGPATVLATTFTSVSLTPLPTYDANLDCAVILDSGSPAASVRLVVMDFDTRPGDALIIVDGRSWLLPTLESLSGPMASLPETT